MPPPNPLQQLRDLDRSSVGFPGQLTDVLREDWIKQTQNLPHDDLWELVEYLDSVLNTLDPISHAFCHCLSELQRICDARGVLPTSHVLSRALSGVSVGPLASGTLANIHTGTLDGLKVCVKKVRVYSEGGPNHGKRFYHEAIVWKRMSHPNIVPFHGITFRPPQLVSDLMKKDLMGYINEHPDINRLGLLCDVAEGLKYLHSCNVVHGSVKGTNVLVDQFGRARIAGFSLAAVNPNSCSTCGITGNYNDTPSTAPEVLARTRPLTKEADVFSFAMVVFEALGGTTPFDNLPSISQQVKIMQGKRPPRPVDPGLTDDLWILVGRCWDQEPRSRPEMRGVLQDLASSLLQSLHQFTKSSPDFQVALSQFYDSTEHEGCLSRLPAAELKEFVSFLCDVLRTEGLSKGLLQRTLHNLQAVFDNWTVPPKSRAIHDGFTRLTTNPYAVSRYAEVWRARLNFGESYDRPVDACIKVIKVEKVHKEFHGNVVVWAKLNHPNILRCFGVTVDPLQIATEWMSNGEAMRYVRENQDADRVLLLIGVADGLEYLHSLGMSHGNLKQKNILVDSTGHARLSDIGFSKLIPTGESGFDWADVGADGCRWGAPEIFQDGKFSEQSDVFTYGFVAAEILTGIFIWEEADPTEVRSKILGDDRPSRPEGGEEHALTTDLWRVFEKCWRKEPGGRISITRVLDVLRYLPRQRSGTSYALEKVTAQVRDPLSQERIDKLDEILETNLIFPKERPAFLNSLFKMCYRYRSLPGSMVITHPQRVATSAGYRGGSSDVYRGECDGRPVAVKTIRIYLCRDRGLELSRFCREAVTWRHLRHPNVMPLFGATLDMQTSRFELVSEWMDNGNINKFVKKHREVNRVQLLVDVAHGLEYLHSLNVVHGDLKGANILINKDGRACITDFGLSTIAHVPPRVPNVSLSIEVSKPSMDSTVSLVPHNPGGTIRWMSPELLDPATLGLDDNRPTKQSDCYALGMVVYEVLCGKSPYWERDNEACIMYAILTGVQPSKPDAATTLGFTDGLWWTIECCWMSDRSVRPDVGTVLSQLTHAAWAWERRRL